MNKTGKYHEKYLKHRKYYRDYENNRWKNDPEFRKRRGDTTKASIKKWRDKVIEHFGGRCIKCGFMDKRALQIDHINGGGKSDRDGKITGFYKKVLKDKSGKYQLLCANCNLIKRIENREFRKSKYDK